MECLDTLVRGPVAGCAVLGSETSLRRHVGRSPVRLYIPRKFSDPGVKQRERSIHPLGRRMWGKRPAVWRGQRAYPTGNSISYRPCSLPPSREEAVATALPVATFTRILKLLWVSTVHGVSSLVEAPRPRPGDFSMGWIPGGSNRRTDRKRLKQQTSDYVLVVPVLFDPSIGVKITLE